MICSSSDCLVRREEKRDETTRADAADADHFGRHVFDVISVEQHPTIVGERPPILLQRFHDARISGHVILVKEHRRLIDQSMAAVDLGRDLGKQVLADAALRLGGDLLTKPFCLGIGCGSDHGREVHAVVPEFEWAHLRESAKIFTVRAHAVDRGRPRVLVLELPVAPGHCKTCRQPLDVPLPRCGQRFVEVVDVEDEVALRRGERAEVQQMTIAAGLYPQAGGRRGGKIVRHQRGGTAQEREGAAQHAPVTDGNQLLHALPVGLHDDADGVAPPGRYLQDRVLLTRQGQFATPCLRRFARRASSFA